MSIRSLVACITLLCCIGTASAQTQTNLRSVQIPTPADTITFDSLMVLPNTFLIEGVGSEQYYLDATNARLFLRDTEGLSDTITLRYRVITYDFMSIQRKKDPSLRYLYQTENPFSYVPQSERIRAQDDDLNTIGNISRGIGFGNRQDVVVNSNLNLRISGKINNKVDVLAAVSDQNNPIQPEGNTQQLQDFDRVFIQLSQESSQLTLGDFQMSRPSGSYFMNYNKKSRGLQGSHRMRYANGVLQVSGEGAVSRGRFSRNTFQGLEGNQGPYRLTGSNGEIFIIIISGTEKVYLDGELMLRGEQNDYVIDYNSGEVTFTPNRLITQYSRIVVEFQYSDRNYARSVVHANAIYTADKWSIHANYFTEQDNKNQPFQQSLDGFDSLSDRSAREVLATAGDVDQAFIQRVTPRDEFNPNRIMYVQRDTLGETYYKHAQTPSEDTVFYEVSFSYVGPGNGDYRQKLSNANGKVFEYVPRVGGIPQGDYAPVEILVTPKRRQMATVGGSYKFNERHQVAFEFATSINDRNTFSSLGSEDDQGFGAFLKYQGSHLPAKSPWKLNSDISYEFIDQRFQYVERYRDVEFDRAWNRQLDNPDSRVATRYDENIIRSKLLLTKGKSVRTEYDFSLYDRSGLTTGIQNRGKVQLRNPKNDLMVSGELLRTGTPSEVLSGRAETDSSGSFSLLNNEFTGGQAQYVRRTKWLTIGVGGQTERSKYQADNSDSIFAASYAFQSYNAYIENSDSSKIIYRLGYSERLDLQPIAGEMQDYTVGKDLSLLTAWRGKKNGEIKITGIYRELEFLDTFASSFQPENTLQGRFETNFRAFKKVVRTSVFYQVATGQEQRREFSYIRVGDGNGNYIWNDYDSNGVQSLNEFEIASNLDASRANFIRQFLPTQQFIKSYSNQFNHSIRITPAVVWRKEKKGLKRFISRFSDLNTVRIEKKVTQNDLGSFINPFSISVDDTALVSTTTAIRNALFFNQTDPKYGFDFNLLRSTSKVFLVTGFDSREATEYGLKGRWNVTRSWSLVAEGNVGQRAYESEFLTDRSFDYAFSALEPRIVYQYLQKFRVSGIYNWFAADNSIAKGGERARNNEYGFELRWNTVNRGNIKTNFSYVLIDYDGQANQPLAYELLEGLLNGENYTWQIQAEYRFPNNIQLLINYDGRKSEDTDAIHAGRVQARYLF